jgi:MarR family transcriptional regulator, transcriptional regulator for hemolysin
MFFEFTRGNQLRAIDSSRHVPDLEERFDSALRNTAKGWRQAVDRHLTRLGVSQAGWMTIAEAMHARLPLSQSKLADKIAISRASMVQTIDRLVRDGLVKRESSAADRRVKRIVITDAGIHLYAVIRNEVAAARRQWVATIEPESLGHLTELLETLLDHMP